MDATRRRRIRRPAASPAGPSVILAVIAGQSNAEGGRGLTANRDAGDVDVANAWQFVGYSGAGTYRTIISDITPLLHYSGWTDFGTPETFLGPGEYLARQLLADNPAAKIVLVPCAKGSTPMAAPGDAWYPHASSGGYLFENMIAQANLARTAALALFPGASVAAQFYWVQGEHESGNSVSRATYLASLNSFISNARSRVTGASAAKFVIGSMIPRLWAIGSPQYQAGYAAINAAHVDASVANASTFYLRGPADSADGLHYSPQAAQRAFGLAWGAVLADSAGPAMTSAATGGNAVGNQIALPLTCNDTHSTFHINGGAGAANFEISDHYITPTLRWAGNGTGPAIGSYVVGVRARDGAGNYGATQTVTWTVAAAGVGSWSNISSPAGTGTSSTTHAFTTVPFGTGLAVVAISGFFITGVALTPSGGGADINLTLTAQATGSHAEIWQGAVTSGNYTVTVTHSPATDACLITALTGEGLAGSTATDTAGKAAATFGSNPQTTSDALTIATNGIGLCVITNSTLGAISWNNGAERSDQAISRAGGGGYAHSVATFAATATPSADLVSASYGAMIAAAWA